jgi:hypothetical protein
MLNLLRRKDGVPTGIAPLTIRENLFSLAPIGGEGWGEGAIFTIPINDDA